MDRHCDKSEAEKLAMVLQELKPKPINNTNVNDMEIEIAHEYEQTPRTIEESETHDSDTDSILSKETAILEAGDIDESITPESVVSDSIYIYEDEDGDTVTLQDVTEMLCEFCGEIVYDGILIRNHIRVNHQHLEIEINEINEEEGEVIEISSDSSVDMDIPVVAANVIKSKKYI